MAFKKIVSCLYCFLFVSYGDIYHPVLVEINLLITVYIYDTVKKCTLSNITMHSFNNRMTSQLWFTVFTAHLLMIYLE